MKVLLEGWKRSVNIHQPISCDVSEADLHAESDRLTRGLLENGAITNVGLLQGEPDGLDVRAYAHDFMGRGSFVVTVRLTKREIANLARIAFAEDRLSDVINALSKSERGVRLPKRPIPVAR